MFKLICLVLISSAVWALWSFVVGFTFNRVGHKYLKKERTFVTTHTRVFLKKLMIDKWKDKVPEAGDMFKGGTSKSTLPGQDYSGLEQFMFETRRAEYVHYFIMLITPIFFLFNPVWLSLTMVTYAFIANVPCVLIQRYNRSRIMNLLDRK